MKKRPVFLQKITFRSILFNGANVIVMLLLALYWLSLPRTFGDEAFFIKWTKGQILEELDFPSGTRRRH